MNRRSVEVKEFWTRHAGWRKIGSGKWEPIELHGSLVPVLFLRWVDWGWEDDPSARWMVRTELREAE